MVTAGLLSLAFTSFAFASGPDRDRGHRRDRGHERQHKRDGDREREREGCNSQPAAAPTVAIVSPVDGTFTPLMMTTLQVNYTAPSGAIPLITLYRDGVVVDTFAILTGSTAGTVVFVQNISLLNGATAFQAAISYVASSGSADDHDGEHAHHKGEGKKCGGKRDNDDHDDDDDDEGSGGGAVTTVLSNVVNVLHQIGTPPPAL